MCHSFTTAQSYWNQLRFQAWLPRITVTHCIFLAWRWVGDMRVLEDLGLKFLISLMYNSMSKTAMWWALQLLQLYIKSKNKTLALTHWHCIPWCTTQDFFRYWEFDCSCTSQFQSYLNTLGSSVVFFKQSWCSLCNVVGSYQVRTPPFGSSTAEKSLIQFGVFFYIASVTATVDSRCVLF